VPKVYLSLGSNIGDRKKHLRAAVKILKEHEEIKLTEISSLYETEPEGNPRQRKFYNLAVGLKTNLSPRDLLKLCLSIEELFKRERKTKWGPRTIDLDILLYGAKEVEERDLQIPHPRLKERAFMIIPLLEIAPQVKVPSGVPVQSYLDGLQEKAILGVKKIGNLEE